MIISEKNKNLIPVKQFEALGFSKKESRIRSAKREVVYVKKTTSSHRLALRTLGVFLAVIVFGVPLASKRVRGWVVHGLDRKEFIKVVTPHSLKKPETTPIQPLPDPSELQKLKGTIAAKETEIAKLEKDIEALRALPGNDPEIERLQNELADKLTEIQQANDALRQKDQQLMDKDREISGFQTQIANTQDCVVTLMGRMGVVQAELDHAKELSTRLADMVEEKNQEISRLRFAVQPCSPVKSPARK